MADSAPKFVECQTCAAKPGMPPLCAGCLSNRATIDRLRGALEMCERHFIRNKYPKTHPARRVIAAALS